MTPAPLSRRVASIVFVLALTIRAAGSAPQVIPTNGAPAGLRTGLVVGQVVDSTGTPVPEAIVQLTLPQYPQDLPTAPKGRVMADGEGRYFFANLPAGEYYLRAAKEGYAGGVYGQRRASGDYQMFPLGEGERRMDARLTLWKYAVIAGTVLDEAGEPVVGVSVQALAKDVVGGRTRYGTVNSAPYLVPAATTDDRGMFRLSRLVPGTYVVVVPSTQTTMPVGVLEATAQDVSLRNEAFRGGISEISPRGTAKTQQVGDVVLMTANRVLIPPPLSPAGRMDVYRTTYFPAATTAAEAMQIAIKGGEERTDITIGLRPVSAVRVSGRLVAPDGSAPAPMSLKLVGEATADVGDEGFETVTAMSDASGRFTLLGVPAGEYVLKQGNRFLVSTAQEGRPTYWLTQRLSVGTRDISDLTVALRSGVRVEGRVEFRGAKEPLASNVGIIFETPFGEAGQVAASALKSEGFNFSTVVANGQYIIRPQIIGSVQALAGWVVKSVALNGKDITDQVIELKEDATSLVITYTDRVSKITGSAKDANGAPNANATVLAFPVDPQRWSGYGSNPRRVRSVPTSRTGAFTFDHLPPGDYYLVAIDSADEEGWADPKILEGLARQATKLAVLEGEPKTLDLTMKAIR